MGYPKSGARDPSLLVGHKAQDLKPILWVKPRTLKVGPKTQNSRVGPWTLKVGAETQDA